MMGLIRPLALIGLLATLLVGCSDDGETSRQFTIEAAASALPYEEQDATLGGTRGWIPPSPYLLYGDLNTGSYKNYRNLTESSIDVFFAKDGNTTPLHGRLRREQQSNSEEWKWKLALTENSGTITASDYYVYGFIPRDAADDAEIAPFGSGYQDGAILTIKGLKTVTPDACVIIGAKDGQDENTVSGLRAGDFGFKLREGDNVTNYLFLLFDHLYSALGISMKVDADYNALRTIKLREISLQPSSDDAVMKKKMDVTVTLQHNENGSSPISSVVFSTPTDATTMTASDGILYQSSEGITLTAASQSFISSFMPQGVTTLMLTSTYDVYDKKDNLIRKDCKATNKIELKKLISYFVEAERGRKYTINMTIQPTYLYMLSEPDLDNPTLVVEN